MATVDLGKIRFDWQGAYDNATTYVVNDVVSSGGNSYICILASTGNAVSNGTYWDLMSQAGTDGTDVGTTICAQGDVLYRDGSGLQRLPKGTATQQLAMNTGATAPEWITAGGSTTGSGFSATAGSTDALTQYTDTKIIFDVEGWDTESEYDAITNYRYTPTAGKYLIMFLITFNGLADAIKHEGSIRKNGSTFTRWTLQSSGTENRSVSGAQIVDANGTDYYEIYGKHEDAAADVLIGVVASYFKAVRLS